MDVSRAVHTRQGGLCHRETQMQASSCTQVNLAAYTSYPVAQLGTGRYSSNGKLLSVCQPSRRCPQPESDPHQSSTNAPPVPCQPSQPSAHHRSLSKSACSSGNIVFLGVLAMGQVGMIRLSREASGLCVLNKAAAAEAVAGHNAACRQAGTHSRSRQHSMMNCTSSSSHTLPAGGVA